METDVRNAVPFAKSVVAGIQEKNVPFMASSIAYQAFISLLPLLVLVFFLVSIVGDEALAAQVADTTEGVLPEAGQDLLEDSIAGEVATAGTSLIGLVVLVWGSLKIFRGLDTAFSEIYDSAAESSFVDQLRDALVVLVAIGFALVAAAIASGVFAFFPDSVLIGVLNPLLLVVAFTLAFVPMYYFFPDVDVSVREILPGVLVAAVGWAVLQSLFQVYVAFASGSDSAGPLGAVLLILTWLYFGGLILLVGGVVNAIRGDHLTLEDDAADESASDRDLRLERTERERDRLANRREDLERERDLFAHELEASDADRSRLERRVSRLETSTRELERENERLRAEQHLHRDSTWIEFLQRGANRVSSLSIGTLERSEK